MTRCKVCTAEFKQQRMGQKTCADPVCRTEWKRQIEMRKQALREKREQKERLKTRQDWLKEAQSAVNAYRRELLKDEPCISCGRHHLGQYHAGHYISVGSHPELRFEEINIWKQCQPCNTHLSGNLINYRKSLIEKIGIEKVEWLEGAHEQKHYSVSDIKEIIIKYRGLFKELKKNGL